MLDRDQATLARAQADLQRDHDLLQKHVTAQQQVDQAEADAKIAAANLQARPGGAGQRSHPAGLHAWSGRRSTAGPVRSG